MAHDGINENIQPQKEQPQKETLDIIEKRLNIKEHKNTEGLFIKPDGGDDFTKDTLLNIASENPETKTIQIAETPKNDKLFIQKKLNPNLPNVEIGDFSEEEERNAILFTIPAKSHFHNFKSPDLIDYFSFKSPFSIYL